MLGPWQANISPNIDRYSSKMQQMAKATVVRHQYRQELLSLHRRWIRTSLQNVRREGLDGISNSLEDEGPQQLEELHTASIQNLEGNHHRMHGQIMIGQK